MFPIPASYQPSYSKKPLRLIFCAAMVLCFVVPCFAQQVASSVDAVFTADMLKLTIFAKTPAEQEFCDLVIQKRDEGVLPERIILAVFNRAVQQERNRRFFYFKNALEILCRQQGIDLYAAPASPPAEKQPSKLSSLFSFLKNIF